MKLVTFTVIGRNPFPMDMLRHDQCWPRDSNDAAEIHASIDDSCSNGGDPWRVTLQGRYDNTKLYPTIDRWSSFGWSVDPSSIRVG